MSEPNPPDYDLNAIRTFVWVYQTGSVTGAAQELRVTQPAISYTLGKLRALFNDDLFRRSSRGFVPTRVAHDLYPQLLQALNLMDDAVTGSTVFRPETTTRTFRLMMTDLGIMCLFPYIAKAVGSSAPEARLEVIPMQERALVDRLRNADVDTVIGLPRPLTGDLHRDHLMDMPYVGLCAMDHPRLSSRPTRQQLAAESRIGVVNALGHQHVEVEWEAIGAVPTPSITVPNFSVLEQTLAVTEHVSIVPLALADIVTQHRTVRRFRLPMHVEPGHVNQLTLKRRVPSAPVAWLRSTVRKALAAYPYPKYADGG